MKKIIIAIIFLYFQFNSFSQNNDVTVIKPTKEYTAIVDSLEKYKTTTLTKEQLKQLDFYFMITDWKNALMGLGIIGLLLYLFRKQIKDGIIGWISGKLKEKKDDFDAIQHLKNSKTILVISSGVETNTNAFLTDFFKEMKFKKENVFFETINASGTTNCKYDLVFANNEDGKLKQIDIEKYVQQYTVLFYLGSSGTWGFKDSNSKILERLNLANNRAQIYGNLMSSLEYHNMMKPSIQLSW